MLRREDSVFSEGQGCERGSGTIVPGAGNQTAGLGSTNVICKGTLPEAPAAGEDDSRTVRVWVAREKDG
jgi:hypothetical protein